MTLHEVSVKRQKESKKFVIALINLLFDTYDIHGIERCPHCKTVVISGEPHQERQDRIVCDNCKKIMFPFKEASNG